MRTTSKNVARRLDAARAAGVPVAIETQHAPGSGYMHYTIRLDSAAGSQTFHAVGSREAWTIVNAIAAGWSAR